MKPKRRSRDRSASGTVAAPPLGVPPRHRFARWRALSLSLVYVVFAIHIIHWKLAGKTLAPLELNEVMYTLELGILTAGFLFMALLVLGTMIFGRFFCSWACHIMVLQDLCAWILRRIGIRRKPIRSRLLLLVPPLTALYMFVWPQLVRAWQSRSFPTFHLATDADGWASFLTDNFWRNLPSTPVTVLTFAVCGFLVVYLLGSRTFCTYVCPYGAVFGLADRFAPGRIRVSDACQQCGTCTATCTSGVRVHEEVKRHGMIVNPACLKDLDCVEACPQRALRYTFTRPSLFRSVSSGGRFGRVPYDFTWVEELLMASVFLVGLLTFRGLYSRVPFLLSLALGAALAYVAVMAKRFANATNLTFASFRLIHGGKVTPSGRAFVGLTALLAAFVGHSAVVRYHEYLGLRQTMAWTALPSGSHADATAQSAWRHLRTADHWGLINNERVERSLLALATHTDRFEAAEVYARRLLRRNPADFGVAVTFAQALASANRNNDAEAVLRAALRSAAEVPSTLRPSAASACAALGGLYAQRGAYDQAVDALRRAVELDPHRASAHAELGGFLAEVGQFDDAIESLRTALALDDSSAETHYNLGTILAHLERYAEAVPQYEAALTITPDDAALHNNLGFAYARTGRPERAKRHFQRALMIDASNADAHFNLGRLYASAHDPAEANRHFQAAASLDPRYAHALGLTPGQ